MIWPCCQVSARPTSHEAAAALLLDPAGWPPIFRAHPADKADKARVCLRHQWTLLPMLGLLPLSPSMRLGLSALLHSGSNTRG